MLFGRTLETLFDLFLTLYSMVQLQPYGLHVSRGSIQEKSSNLKFVEKRVKFHLSH